MDRMIYVAMNGAKHLMARQAVNNHNLANLNTTGFRADLDASITNDKTPIEVERTRLFASIKDIGISNRSGDVYTTGRGLDIAIDDVGFIALQDQDGSEAFTRNGELFIGPGGMLLTDGGYSVMGDGGPIAIPDHQKLEIGKDGTISIMPPGETLANMMTIDRIKLVNIDPSQLHKGKNGLLKTDGNVDADSNITITSNALESSNVSSVEALTTMISLARDYEIHIKLMKAAEENEAAATRVLKIS